MADKRLWAVVDSDIEHMHFDPQGVHDKKVLAKLEADRAAALDKEHNLTPHELAKAMTWLRENRPELISR